MEISSWTPAGAEFTLVLEDQQQVLGGNEDRKRKYYGLLEHVFEKATYAELLDGEEIIAVRGSQAQVHFWPVNFEDGETGNTFFVVYQETAVFLRLLVAATATSNNGWPTPQQIAEAETLAEHFWREARQELIKNTHHGIKENGTAQAISCTYCTRIGRRHGYTD